VNKAQKIRIRITRPVDGCCNDEVEGEAAV